MHLNDPAAWIELMDAAGIRRSVGFRGRAIDNDGLRDAAERWPGRLLPFVSVSPEHREYRDRWMLDDPSLAEVADSLLSTGAFYGIGEISVSHDPRPGFPGADFDPSGRVMRALMDVARRHRVPVTVHVELDRLRQLEDLLEAFRDVSVIWAHGGYSTASRAEALLDRHPNLVYELSARTWSARPGPASYMIVGENGTVSAEWLRLIERKPERFVVGTDSALRSLPSDARKIDSVLNLLEQLAPPARAAVGYENLERLVGGAD